VSSSNELNSISEWQQVFLERHGLGIDFLTVALKWFNPLAHTLAAHQDRAGRPILVAINGCQGSGKTTITDYLRTLLVEEHGHNAVGLSLDDFYLTRAEREALATSTHPLLATRGVPGTHDMQLLQRTLTQALDAKSCESIAIPRFDKSADDRRSINEWDSITAPIQIIFLEGWCLGATPEPPDNLSRPHNDLERYEDPDGVWRHYSNEVLRQEFQPLYELVDQWVMLRAPSFDCVFDWRREQERKLAATLSPDQAAQLMNDDQLQKFVQHYERITNNCIVELSNKVNHLFLLNKERQVTAYRQR
jgi:D-glycerate 3-kinase